jgi:hypothetical protein
MPTSHNIRFSKMGIGKKREPNGSAWEGEKTCLWALAPGQADVNVTNCCFLGIIQS